jgi:flagellar hook assembly protein FlgD
MNYRLLIILCVLTLVLLSVCLLFSKQILIPAGVYVDEVRNTNGTLTFTVRTVTYNGSYHPKNVGAIWITNSSNQFVKTIKIWAASRRSHLVKWVASSANNTTGAITSATINSHQLHTVTWNGNDYQNVAVPDGNYNVNVEYTENNSTTSNPGKYRTVSFAKGTAAVNTVPTSDAFFTNLSLIWAPVVANDDQHNTLISEVLNQNYPNPFKTTTTIKYYLKQHAVVQLNIYNPKGQLVSHLVSKAQPTGWYEVKWNRTLDNGTKAVAGKYICRLVTGNKTMTKVMTITD